MRINNKTRVLSDIVPEDKGKSFEDVLITCKHIYCDREGFKAFVCEGSVSCCAKLKTSVSAGVTYKVSGSVGEYGGKPQLVITSMEPVKDDDFELTQRADFLIGIFEKDGLSARTAKKICSLYGDGFADKLKNCPDDVAFDVKGLSTDLARGMGETLVNEWSVYKRYLDLMMSGLSFKQAKKCDRYAEITPEQISENPFCLSVIKSFSFDDLSALSASRDIPELDSYKVFSAVRSELMKYHTSTASTYANPEQIRKKTCVALKVSDNEDDNREKISQAFSDAIAKGCDLKIFCVYKFEEGKCISCDWKDEGARLCLSEYFRAEVTVKKEIRHFVNADFSKPSDNKLDKTIADLEKKYGISLDDKQKDAVRLCMYRPVTVITGGPGVGKTTIMGILSGYFDDKGIKSVFAAPTGRAAKRLSEATGKDAYTLHRLLDARPDPLDDDNGFFFARNSDNPIEARVIVVDEMSMVDTVLFSYFLRAVGKHTSLILIGDPDQLPSVGCGNVLSDIIASGVIPCVSLDTVHRHSDGGDIASNAIRVLEGKELVDGTDFKVITCKDNEEALRTVSDIYLTKIIEADPDIMILSPTKKEDKPLSTYSLNKLLQTISHTPEDTAGLTKTGFGSFVTGDRVIQIKNNYSLEYFDPSKNEISEGVFNGEIGTITGIDDISGVITVRFEDGKKVDYSRENTDNIELAYSITVHKSQGCEFSDVVIVLGDMYYELFRRNLLYTAVTRGKNRVTIIETGGSLSRFLNSKLLSERKTSLRELLEQLR